jgi:hypothetical protein
MNSMRVRAASAWLTMAVLATAAPAMAVPLGQPLAIAKPNAGLAEQVHWRGRGGGWGWGRGAFIGGFGFGAWPYDYGFGPYYYRVEDDDPPPGYVPPPPEGDLAYCSQHHKSYNPRTGLYRGKDGRRQRCP